MAISETKEILIAGLHIVLKNKEVIGYEIGKNIDSDLSMSALGNAIATRGRHKGPIFHSDRGTQYSSKKYKAMLKKTVLSVQ